MWILIAAAGTGIFVLQVLSMALVGKKRRSLEAQLDKIADMGEQGGPGGPKMGKALCWEGRESYIWPSGGNRRFRDSHQS